MRDRSFPAPVTPSLAPLGELEQAVMDQVWRHFPATAGQVCKRMTRSRPRAYTTIMTTLVRLHRKGLLRRSKVGLAWCYEPAISRASFEKGLADHAAADILSAHGQTALAAFVDAAANLDASLLDHLRRLVDRRRKGRR